MFRFNPVLVPYFYFSTLGSYAKQNALELLQPADEFCDTSKVLGLILLGIVQGVKKIISIFEAFIRRMKI